MLAAVPAPPEMIGAGVAHALAFRCRATGDERDLRDVAQVLGGPGRGRLLRGAADLADEHDGLGLLVRREQLEDVEERGPDDRVAADADAGGLAEAGIGHGLDGLIGERAGAAHHPDSTLAMDGARDDADLGPAGRRRSGAVGPDQPGAAGTDQLHRRDHVEGRDALGDAEDGRDAGVGCLHHGIRRASGGHEDAGRVGARLAHRLGDGVEDGDRPVEGHADRPCPASRPRRSMSHRPAWPGHGTRPRVR